MTTLNPVSTESATSDASVQWSREGGQTVLMLSGIWNSEDHRVSVSGEDPNTLPDKIQVQELEHFDSSLPAYLLALIRERTEESGEKAPEPIDWVQSSLIADLPADLRGLMVLALSVPEEKTAQSQGHTPSELRKLGKITLAVWSSVQSVLEFTGLSILSFLKFLTGKAHFRTRDFLLTLQECGLQALPIVSLISFLIGLILAFVGNVQLASFGASIFVADLVGIAMVREMGVVMTGIIMSGRTGAAFAANLGSMKANQEIDALSTFGFNPFDFLVLPRLLALILMMPILTIYANLVGILGGMLVGMMVEIPPVLYWNQTVGAISLTTASLGVMKSVFFGAAIAIAGCLQGMNAETSSAGVGQATTRAVVASITAIIVLDSAFAAIFTVLGI